MGWELKRQMATGHDHEFLPRAVVSRSAPDEIARQLQEAIVSGALPPGHRLKTEPDLAKEFGVSRATVREAIKVLRARGVLRTIRGSHGGHFVMSPQTDALAASIGETFGLWFDAGDVTIAEVDEARLVVESACVRLAAKRRTDAELAEMREALSKARDPEISTDEFLDLDVEFHRVIARAARNRLLELPMTAIHLVRPRTNQFLRKHDRPRVVRQHQAIYRGIEQGAPDTAAHALELHVRHLDRERRAATASTGRDASVLALHEIAPAKSRRGSERRG